MDIVADIIDLNQYEYDDPISLFHAHKKIFDKLKIYQNIIIVWLKTMRTKSEEKLIELRNFLSLNNKYVNDLIKIIKFLVDKFPPQLVHRAIAIFTPNMTFNKFIDIENMLNFKCKKGNNVYFIKFPKFATPSQIYNAIINLAKLNSDSFYIKNYFYQSAVHLQSEILSIYRWCMDRIVFRHNSDDEPPVYVTISSLNKKWRTQLNQAFNKNVIYPLFHCQDLLNIRHSASNKNEHAHSCLLSMIAVCVAHGVEYSDLIQLLFLFTYNYKVCQWLSNNIIIFTLKPLFRRYVDDMFKFYSEIRKFDPLFDDLHEFGIKVISFDPISIKPTYNECIERDIISNPVKWNEKHDKILNNYIAKNYNINNIQLDIDIINDIYSIKEFAELDKNNIIQKIKNYFFMYFLHLFQPVRMY